MNPPAAHASVSLVVKRSSPVHHCPQAQGGHSIRLTNIIGDDVVVYLDGTPEELIDWATKVRFVAIRLLPDEAMVAEITKPEEEA